jgi:Rne/Rng family ribonuclease
VTTRLVLERRGATLLAARLEDDRLIEVHAETARRERIVDRLLVGRVTRVEPRLQAAFLDIGDGRSVFLNAKDARFLPGVGPSTPIERAVREGERLIVQGLREAAGDKGGRVTADLRLVGLYLVLRPRSEAVEASSHLGKRAQALLLERGARLFPKGGVLLRRAAAGADDAALLREAAELGARWSELEARARHARPGPLDIAGDEPLSRLLRTVLGNPVDALAAAEPDLLAGARHFAESRLPGVLAVEALPGPAPAFESTGVADQIATALAREVPLQGGGRLLIEPTAALTAIDVDGGAEHALGVNLEAAGEIARQVRLRNLGGIIVVDFIGMGQRRDRQRVVDALRRAFARDPFPVQVHDSSPLGLVEIGRPRRGATLAALLAA